MTEEAKELDDMHKSYDKLLHAYTDKCAHLQEMCDAQKERGCKDCPLYKQDKDQYWKCSRVDYE